MNIPIGSYYVLLKNYLKPQWVRVLLLTLALFSAIGLRVANPQIIRRFLDAGQTGADSTQLLYAGALFLGFAILVQILSVTATYLGEVIGWNATNALRADLALHALKLDMTYHNTKTPGEMIERIDGDVVNLAIFFSQMVIQVIGSLLLMAGIIAVLAWEDWRVGLALAAFSALTLYALSKTRAMAIPYHTAARDAHSDCMALSKSSWLAAKTSAPAARSRIRCAGCSRPRAASSSSSPRPACTACWFGWSGRPSMCSDAPRPLSRAICFIQIR